MQVDFGEMTPGGHGGFRVTVDQHGVQVVIGGDFPERRAADFILSLGQVARAWAHLFSRHAVAGPLRTVADGALVFVDHSAAFEGRFLRSVRRERVGHAVKNKDDDFPDILFREDVFPGRHHRVPGLGLLREAGASFHDPPERVRFRAVEDRAFCVEIRGPGSEPVRQKSLAVQQVPMTKHAVLEIEVRTLADELRDFFRLGPKGIGQVFQGMGFTPDGDRLRHIFRRRRGEPPGRGKAQRKCQAHDQGSPPEPPGP